MIRCCRGCLAEEMSVKIAHLRGRSCSSTSCEPGSAREYVAQVCHYLCKIHKCKIHQTLEGDLHTAVLSWLNSVERDRAS
jgi:hypothetical protein